MFKFAGMEEVYYDVGSIRVAHGATLDKHDDGSIVFSDSYDRDWHLARIYNEALRGAMVGLQFRLRPTALCQTDFYVNAIGGIHIAVVSKAGRVKNRGVCRAIEARADDDLSFAVDLLYESQDCSVTFGSYSGAGIYMGSGTPQFVFKKIQMFVKKGVEQP